MNIWKQKYGDIQAISNEINDLNYKLNETRRFINKRLVNLTGNPNLQSFENLRVYSKTFQGVVNKLRIV